MTPDLPPVLPGLPLEVGSIVELASGEIQTITEIKHEEAYGRHPYYHWYQNTGVISHAAMGDEHRIVRHWPPNSPDAPPIARANGIGGEVDPCMICGRPVPDYVAKYCCNGRECGCMGQPIEPCVCSPECDKAIFDNIGTPMDERRIKAGIALYEEVESQPTSDPCESESPKPEEIRFADMTELVKEDEPNPPKPEGETPLTDGEIHYRVGREDGWNEIVRANFARQLESDLAAARATITSLRAALEALLRYTERNTCLHEETHRGGAIWEICDSCGRKWADDEGGMPEDAHDWPKEIADAQAALSPASSGKGEG